MGSVQKLQFFLNWKNAKSKFELAKGKYWLLDQEKSYRKKYSSPKYHLENQAWKDLTEKTIEARISRRKTPKGHQKCNEKCCFILNWDKY